MTYVRGRDTSVSIKGAEKGVVEGKDFADALFPSGSAATRSKRT